MVLSFVLFFFSWKRKRGKTEAWVIVENPQWESARVIKMECQFQQQKFTVHYECGPDLPPSHEELSTAQYDAVPYWW